MGTIREALQKMNIKDKEAMALQAALIGLDLDSAIETFDQLFDLIGPSYRRNLEVLGVDLATDPDMTVRTTGVTGKSNHTTIIDEAVGNEGWETDPESLRASDLSHNNRCEHCGIILFDDDTVCPECIEGSI